MSEIEFFVHPRIEQDGDLWSAYCDELKLASCGATREEAEHNLRDTLAAFGRAFRRQPGALENVLDEVAVKWQEVQTEGMRVIV
jgi:predicted RNase H-like HicB family nuclease